MLVLLPKGKCLLCPRLEGPVSRSFWSQIKPPLRDLQLLLIELFLQSCGSGILADGGLDDLIRRTLLPQAELGFLNVGSCPSRRKSSTGIGHLRQFHGCLHGLKPDLSSSFAWS
ncbi:putative phosphoenolpyruvate carboxylase [Rosa chinensis]|uniref:Putative phosphoenolpyruvate carboxylase n=1 Tax=Rosa chinensis TaxID=74649 RepID=A0A2P6R1L3_ROSCH|nr:putative phosphoenolpyruvate carboxylase [Rosa chinensis]